MGFSGFIITVSFIFIRSLATDLIPFINDTFVPFYLWLDQKTGYTLYGYELVILEIFLVITLPFIYLKFIFFIADKTRGKQKTHSHPPDESEEVVEKTSFPEARLESKT